jgi:hypothetical protein
MVQRWRGGGAWSLNGWENEDCRVIHVGTPASFITGVN